MRPWQEYLLSMCPPQDVKRAPWYPGCENGRWRFADPAAYHDDVMLHFGPIASVCLSMAYRPKIIVEMGVLIGSTALILCKANPEARVHGVDVLRVVPEGSASQYRLPTGYLAIKNECDNLTLHVGNSWDFAMPGAVDLCFIDADHTGDAPYRDSLRAWENRNAKGNWCIAWDDYHESNPDVQNAVNRFVGEVGMELHKLASWYYIGTLPHSEVEAFM